MQPLGGGRRDDPEDRRRQYRGTVSAYNPARRTGLAGLSYPWIEHIRDVGPASAFAEPFGNYNPPSLYLFAAFAALPIPALVAIKLVAFVSVAALAWSASRLARALGCDDAASAALFALALPTVILNAALGQVDGLWTACCLMALAAGIERRTLAMAAWAALAFAFKAQAAFLAPLMLAIVIRDRKWLALAFPRLSIWRPSRQHGQQGGRLVTC